jgi:hypothetical protein
VDLGTGPATVIDAVAMVAAGLLVPAGIAKLRAPVIARRALELPVRGGDAAVRLIGIVELAIAGLAIGVGGRLVAAALAVLYLGFALVAFRQRQRGASCGCFATSRAPTRWSHVVVNLVAATTAAVSVAIGGLTPLVAQVDGGPLSAALLLATFLVAVATVQAVITHLPELRAAIAGSPTTGAAT